MKFLILIWSLSFLVQNRLTTIANIIITHNDNVMNQEEQALLVFKYEQLYSTKNSTEIKNCVDPSDSELQSKLDRHNEMVMQLLAEEDGKINNYLPELDIKPSEYDMDSIDCNITRFTGIQKRSLCPYVLNIVIREDRFPRVISK